MESVSFDLLMYTMVVLTGWTLAILIGIVGNMLRAKRGRGTFRKSDTKHLMYMIGVACVLTLLTLFYPELSYSIPSTIIALQIGIILPLIYLTEKHWKDWVNLCEIIRSSHKG